jgi:2'-5' RNA ligase
VTARLFVAAWPSPDVVAALRALPRPEVAGLRWTPEDQWHVTLRFLGQVGSVEPLSSALRALDLGASLPVEARLGPKTMRLGKEILAVGVTGLDRLAALVVEATTGIGQAPDARRFRGHITLARSRGVDLRPLCGAAVSGSWTVSEITIVSSRTQPDRAHYEVVERFGAS